MPELSYAEQTFEIYEALPNGPVKGAVIVIHEVWGLNDHTRDIADRLAAAGYRSLAPNLLAETDIASHAAQLQLDLFNPQKRNQAQPRLRELMAPLHEPDFAPRTAGRLQACFDYLYDQPGVSKKVSVMGFCFGGSYSFTLAAQEPRLAAAIPFYGHAPLEADTLAGIKCPVLAFYGEQDEGLMKDLPQLKQLMQQAGVDFTAQIYPDCGHAFFNDTNPYAYNQAAAKDAWRRSLEFLERCS